MFYTNLICDIGSMVYQMVNILLCLVVADKITEGIQPNQTIGISDCSQLIICQVSCCACQRLRIGMRCQNRACCQIDNIPEGFFIDMRNVQNHLLFLQLLNCLLAQLGYTPVGVTLYTGCQCIFFIPCQHCMTRTQVIQLIDLAQILADACQTLDPQQDCKFACCLCRLQLLHIMNQNKFLCFSHFSLDALNDSFHFILRCVTIVGICPDNEACTADAALTQSVQMMILQYLCFACFSFISYIAENVTMSIKNHTVSLFSHLLPCFCL